jgi:hypothetical protein
VTRRLSLSPFPLLSHYTREALLCRSRCVCVWICCASALPFDVQPQYTGIILDYSFRKILRGVFFLSLSLSLSLSLFQKNLCAFGLAKLMELMNMFFLLFSSVPGNSDLSRRTTMAGSHIWNFLLF